MPSPLSVICRCVLWVLLGFQSSTVALGLIYRWTLWTLLVSLGQGTLVCLGFSIGLSVISYVATGINWGSRFSETPIGFRQDVYILPLRQQVAGSMALVGCIAGGTLYLYGLL
jgi:hypothetical protein